MATTKAVVGSLRPGAELARYRIESLIGAGGMGEVYAARDTSLGRRVALKILPASSASSERIARFVREAEAASALNHPAIVSIFESGSAEVDGERVHFIAMELVEGETLGDWMRAKHTVTAKVELLAGIADGLARAHAGGIVHRDLKPANILVGRGGYPKIADFGVAKLTERGARTPSHETAPDALLGTAAYMSPEQIMGGEVDARSDVFSFGCVAFEVVAGRAPFRRANSVETMHAILNDDVAFDEIAPQLRRIVRRCLTKDPDDRYQSMRDVALDLRELARESDDAPRKETATGARLLILIGILIAVLFVAILIRTTNAERVAIDRPSPTMKMERLTNSGKTLAGKISPDGKFVVYVTQDGSKETLWVKQIATGTNARLLPPSEDYFLSVSVSPDNNYVYYAFATHAEPNVVDLYRIPVLGGEPRKIVPDMEGGYSISPDGSSVAFRRFNALQRDYILSIADVNSGEERELLRRRSPDAIFSPTWTPDRNRIGFVLVTTNPHDTDIRICDIDITTKEIRRVDRPAWRAATNWRGIDSFGWLADGSGMLIGAAEERQPSQIWLVPNDGRRPRKITSDIGAYSTISTTNDARTIVAMRHESSQNIWLVTLDGVERARPLTTGQGNRYGNGGVIWLRDGRIAFSRWTETTPTLETVGLKGGEPQPFMRGSPVFWNARLSPDGTKMAFLADDKRSVELFVSDTNGSNRRQITNDGRPGWHAWFPDGKSVAFISSKLQQRAARVSIDGGEAVRITEMPVNAIEVSPDGRSLLCRLRSRDSSASPLWRTAITPIDGKGETRYFNVPQNPGSSRFQWNADGSAFYYLDFLDGVTNLWLQPTDGGAPRQLTHFDSGRIYTYDVSHDGKSIVMSRGDPVSDLVLIRDFR